MNEFIPTDLRWRAPWQVVADGTAFEMELQRELIRGHPLYGVQAVAVARRLDCDDVLFRLDHPSYTLAVVHLTWRTRPGPEPKSPHTVLFADWEEWIKTFRLLDNDG
jgi:hypothetical protein